MRDFEIVTDCARVQSLIQANAESFPNSAILVSARGYFSAVFDNSWKDVSFAVVERDLPIAACLAWTKDGKYLFFDRPAFIELNSKLADFAGAHHVLALLRNQLKSVIAGANHVRLGLSGENELSRQLLREMLSFATRHTVTLQGSVDLSRPLDEIRQEFRSGHRQSINKGAEAYDQVDFYSGDTPAYVFASFRELHKQAAGRITRNSESWDKMFQALLEDKALLTVGTVGGKIISCSFFWLGAKVASYGSAAYDRDYFSEIPVAHFPLYASMGWLKSAGAKQLFLGQIFHSGGTSKEASVAAFKRGFTQRVELLHEIEVARAV